MSGSEVVAVIREVIEWAALGIEILGAAVIVAGVRKVVITRGTIRYLFQLDRPGAYEKYKHQMGEVEREMMIRMVRQAAEATERSVAGRHDHETGILASPRPPLQDGGALPSPGGSAACSPCSS
jgi:hypothetical protein